MPNLTSRRFRFDQFEVDFGTAELRKRGIRLKLSGQPLRILETLLERPGEVVSRDELRHLLWENDTFVDFERGLNAAVNRLREALGDSATKPRYIETLPRLGYRFIGSLIESGFKDSPSFEVANLSPVTNDSSTNLAADPAGSPPPRVSAAGSISPDVAVKVFYGSAKHRWPRRNLAWLFVSIAVALIFISAATLFEIKSRSSTPAIATYTQLTHDGLGGDVVGTDGSRLYLNRGVGSPVGQVSISGGEIEPIQIPVPVPYLVDVSADGSMFLIESYAKGLLPAQPLYAGQIVGGAYKYLADVKSASWSPDGKSVIYSTPENSINAIQSDGSGAHKLATSGATVDGVYWSPDIRHVRFDRDSSIWEMSPDGSSPHNLFANWRPSVWKCCGTFSPDGNFFIFVAASQIFIHDERQQVFRSSAFVPVQLTSGPIHWHNPVFSKDGKKIFASGSTSRGELVQLDPKTHQFQPFLGSISADFVDFSKDGRFITYVSFPDGVLWKANRDGTNRVQLSQPPLSPKLPRWSPDGTQIIFMDNTDGPVKIYIVSPEQGSPQRLLPDDRGPEVDPNWSPDGSKIIFANSPEVGRDRNSTLRVIDVSSHQMTSLPGSEGMNSPRWSPDGQFIVSESWDSKTLHLFQIKTQHWSILDKDESAFPTWSRDSRYVYFLRYRKKSGIYRVRALGGAPELVKDLNDVHTTGFYGLWLALDPNDAPLLLRDVGTRDIYALTLEH
jgi:Tol biopolymer transport system component/DNA-binding winged helix-turn-helix (wHTH) protein